MSGPTVKFSVDLKRRPPRIAAPPPQDAAGRHASAPATPTAPVSTAARTLALAHFIEREVRAGRWKSYREAASALGVCHARVQHIVGLLFLPAPVQVQVLADQISIGERGLRRLAAQSLWTRAAD
jgi:hypothetical protein